MEELLRNAKNILKSADMFKCMSEFALAQTVKENPVEELAQIQLGYINKINSTTSASNEEQEATLALLYSQWEDHPEYLIPFAVNAAFACELYMKATLTFEGKKVPKNGREGHNLQTLFSDLSKDLRNEIEEEYKLHFEADFNATLSQNQFAFEDMRYWYEKDFGQKDFLFLEFLCDVLSQGAKQIIR